MKIFLVISLLFVISFFFITKDKGEELKTVDIKLEKNVIVEKLKKESFTKTLKFSGFS